MVECFQRNIFVSLCHLIHIYFFKDRNAHIPKDAWKLKKYYTTLKTNGKEKGVIIVDALGSATMETVPSTTRRVNEMILNFTCRFPKRFQTSTLYWSNNFQK